MIKYHHRLHTKHYNPKVLRFVKRSQEGHESNKSSDEEEVRIEEEGIADSLFFEAGGDHEKEVFVLFGFDFANVKRSFTD